MDIGEFFRKATRPVVTIIFAAVIAQVVVQRIEAPEWFIALSVTIIAFWFGERTITHIKEKTTGKQKEEA
jgi:hypothetical protein